MDWCVQLSGFLGMSVYNPYILPPCRTVKTGAWFFWGPADQQTRQKTVQRKPLLCCEFSYVVSFMIYFALLFKNWIFFVFGYCTFPAVNKWRSILLQRKSLNIEIRVIV